ncbi:MAG: hypothetical protein VX609_05425 [Verrucomicrobiota bacterium]|nr:hypothetical protein [Verrucomicrobiota bacterium]|tara:strand:- start:374 stop:850 length:477 start_codon:yes stop_codon:yes gene_type:complete
MKKTKGIRKGDQPVVVKPVWWRQVALTLFLFICGFFFAFVDYVGPIISWVCTIIFGILFLLSLLDQLVEWSRLRINEDGYDLRTWFKRQRFRHEEIDFFSSQTYLNRQLIILNLRKQALEKLELKNPELPFPCAFGQPVEDVLKILQASLSKTPRKIS